MQSLSVVNKQFQSNTPFINSFNLKDLIQDLFFAFKIYRGRDLVDDIFYFFSIIHSAFRINTYDLFNSVIELTKICLKFSPVRKCSRKLTDFYGVETIARTLYFAFYLNSKNNRKYNVNERF